MPTRLQSAVYFASPVWVQNALISAYGTYLRRQRETSNTPRYRETLEQSRRLARDAYDAAVDKALYAFLQRARERVAAYSNIDFDFSLPYLPGKGRDALSRFPLLSKSLLKSAPSSYVDAGARHTFTLSTSGTTGSPLTVVCDRESRAYHYAFFDRLWRTSGANMDREWRATFYGRTIIPPLQNEPPFWRHDRAQKNILFSSYHLSQRTISYYVDELNRLRPTLVVGYPSSLATVSRLSTQAKIALPKPTMIMTTAETLTDAQRSDIETAFQCRVTDQYGSTEMSHFVAQCPLGSYHVHSEHGIIEVLDSSGSACESGELGEVVVTGLVNVTMPLIRYRIGDRAALQSGQCDCGMPFPLISRIEGRLDDLIITPSGRQIGRLDPVFKGFGEVMEAQIEQTSVADITVRLVPGPGFDESLVHSIRRELIARVGPDVDITFELVPAIPREKSGKFMAVKGLRASRTREQ